MDLFRLENKTMDPESMIWFSVMNEQEGNPSMRPSFGLNDIPFNQEQVIPSNSSLGFSFDLPSPPLSSSYDQLLDELLASNSGNEVENHFCGNTLVENMEDSDVEDSKTPADVASRLQNLENNYERKKKRAKINRKDLNERFQELMNILDLHEDRKLNRAKVLEKTIEHIRSQRNEVQILRARLGETSAQAHSAKVTPSAQVYPHHTARSPTIPPIPIMSVMPMSWNPQSTGAPYTIHNTRSSSQTSSNKILPSHSVQQSQVESSEQRKLGVKRRRYCEFSMLLWAAREIPSMLMLMDGYALAHLMLACKEMKEMCQRQGIWTNLCRKRWLLRDSKPEDPYKLWKQLDSANKLPLLTCLDNGLAFAHGKTKRINVWALLSQRSNGRTTRTVLVNGRAMVMQVVELYIVVQNMSQHRVRLIDSIQVTSRSSSSHAFGGLTSKFGSHLKPRLFSFNDSIRTSDQLSDCVLLHGDVAVLSAYFECKDLDLEEEFLQSVQNVSVRFQVENFSNMSRMDNICQVNAINTFTKYN